MQGRRKIGPLRVEVRSNAREEGRAHRFFLFASWLLLLAFISPIRVQAQVGAETLSPSSTISILTILPGDEVYSMFGHTAIRVRDPEQGIDHTYNYGTFEFGNPLVFVGKFAYGNLEYVLSVAGFRHMLEFYRDIARRPIIEQILNLTHAQRLKVFAFLERNARPENRAYRYDFLFDNCSTRVRDVLYEQLDSLHYASDTVPEATFRHLLDPYAADRPFLDFGWDLLMGTQVDRLAEEWETMFLPLYLMAAVDSATIESDGQPVPFVTSKDTLFWVEGRGMPEPSAPWPSILMWGVFWLGLSLTILQRSGSWRGIGRWFDGALFFVVGLAGTLMILMWLVSLHTVTNDNWNLLWAWPTHLIVAFLLRRTHPPVWLRAYLIATLILTTIALLGWALWPQELPVAAIPVVLLLALRSAWRAFGMVLHREQTVPVSGS